LTASTQRKINPLNHPAVEVIEGRMETKFSIAVDGFRKSVMSDRFTVSANRSHIVIDLESDRGDQLSLRLDRESVFQIIRDGHIAGMFDNL